MWDEGDGMFGTRHDTQAAGLAGIDARRVRRALAVGPEFESRQCGKGPVLSFVDDTDLEHRIGTDCDAISFTFAARAVDFRLVGVRRGHTLLARPSRMTCGLLRLPDIKGRIPFFCERIIGSHGPAPRLI